MLIWQAISKGYTLITGDDQIKKYVSQGLKVFLNSDYPVIILCNKIRLKRHTNVPCMKKLLPLACSGTYIDLMQLYTANVPQCIQKTGACYLVARHKKGRDNQQEHRIRQRQNI